MSQNCVMNYYCTETYDNSDEYGLNWSDNNLNIKWPISQPILNKRDQKYPSLKKILDENLLPII